jgi:tripartite-type tricarboxylate transporter receptor subunit TctC
MKYFIFVISSFSIFYGLSIGAPMLQAQPFPSHTIQIVSPGEAGAAGDLVLRPFAEELGKTLKTSVIILNKPGAGGTVGADFVAKGKKDGYTLLLGNTSAIVYARASNPEIVPYDPVKDLERLGFYCFFPLTITVQENSPFKTFADLVDFAKKNPGSVRVSTPGQGSINHYMLEIIQSLTGTQFTMVPFKGGAATVTALLGGHVDATCNTNTLDGPHVKAGKLKLLLLTKRMREFPNVPTITELGYKQDLPSAWFAFFAPAGIPEEVKKVLVPAIEKVIRDPELEPKIEKLGYVVDYKSPEELKKLMVSDYETARAFAIKLGLSKPF